MRFLRSVYLRPRLFLVSGIIVFLLVVTHFIQSFAPIVEICAYTFIGLILLDVSLLFVPKAGIEVIRSLPEKFSLGDENKVYISVRNTFPFNVRIVLIDELPVQLQQRTKGRFQHLNAGGEKTLLYTVRPTERGEYHYGDINIYVSTAIGFVEKRIISNAATKVPVYPSFLQMRKFDFLAISNNLIKYGVKRIRRIGHSYEFDQIRRYIPGDDIRSLNWHATAKSQELMVNQYQDERSQNVFAVINTGRIMKMPFEELTLLDHSINSSLALLNVALRKGDQAGLVTFSSRQHAFIPALKRQVQLSAIMEALYHIDTDFSESDYERLYFNLASQIKQYSLILFYTNFESITSLRRALPYLKAIARRHLLVVIFFKNTEMVKMASEPITTSEGVYIKTISMKFNHEKELIARELGKHGIQSILTAPEHLSVNAVNKYLEIKSRGLI